MALFRHKAPDNLTPVSPLAPVSHPVASSSQSASDPAYCPALVSESTAETVFRSALASESTAEPVFRSALASESMAEPVFRSALPLVLLFFYHYSYLHFDWFRLSLPSLYRQTFSCRLLPALLLFRPFYP